MEDLSIRDAITGLIGRAPWGVNTGLGSFVTFEFGEQVRQEDGEPAHGEWHLWLYMTNWRLQTQSDVLAGSSDDREKIDAIFNALDWGKVLAVAVDEPAWDLSLSFDSGYQIKTFSSASIEDRQWILYTPNSRAISVNGGGRYIDCRSDEPDDGL